MSVSIKEANEAIGSIESAYYALILKGIYMPRLSSKAITSKYLLGIAIDKFI